MFLLVTCNLCLYYRAVLDLPKYWSDSEEGTIYKLFVEVSMETWQVNLDWEHQVKAWQTSLLGWNCGKRKLCMVPCHSYKI